MIEPTIIINDHRFGQAMRRAPERVTARVEIALARGAAEIARSARRKAPKAFSTLTNAIISLRMGPLHYRVRAGTNYARAVEEGRKPGKMPGTSKGLMEWVKQKVDLTGTDLERATFVIARSIAKKGIKAQPYMMPAVREGEPRLRQLVRTGVALGIEDAFA